MISIIKNHGIFGPWFELVVSATKQLAIMCKSTILRVIIMATKHQNST